MVIIITLIPIITVITVITVIAVTTVNYRLQMNTKNIRKEI